MGPDIRSHWRVSQWASLPNFAGLRANDLIGERARLPLKRILRVNAEYLYLHGNSPLGHHGADDPLTATTPERKVYLR